MPRVSQGGAGAPTWSSGPCTAGGDGGAWGCIRQPDPALPGQEWENGQPACLTAAPPGEGVATGQSWDQPSARQRGWGQSRKGMGSRGRFQPHTAPQRGAAPSPEWVPGPQVTSSKAPCSCWKGEEHSPCQLLGLPPAFIEKGEATMRIRAQEGPQHPSSLPVPPRRPPHQLPTHPGTSWAAPCQAGSNAALPVPAVPPPPARQDRAVPWLQPPPHATPSSTSTSSVPRGPPAPRCSSSSSSSFKGPLVLLQPVQTAQGSPRLQGQARVPSAPSRCGSAPQPPSLSSARPPRRAGMGLDQAPEAGARPGAERRLPARHATSARGAHLGQHHQGHPPLLPRSLPPHQTTGWDRKKQGFVGRRGLWG